LLPRQDDYMSDAWDEAVDRVDEVKPDTAETPTKPRPIRSGKSGRSDLGPEDVLRMVRGFTGTQDDPLSTTLRSLASRLGMPDTATTGNDGEEQRAASRARAALLARVAELAKTADAEQLAHLTETWALLSGSPAAD
jgi:hypothetical protein